jgi:uncharacterized protein YdaU (DUF1376 family)
MCELPFIPLFTSDYLGKTHPGLTLEQHGAYLLLLMFSWQRPTCALPDDNAWLAGRLGIHGNRWRHLRKTVLERFFKQDESGEFFSPRLRKERENASKTRRNAVEKAEKRWSRSKENNDLAENRHMPLTHTHTKEERKKDTSYPSPRARDDGSEDLFGAGKQAPASPAERGLPRTELVDRPTSPINASPSPTAAVPQGKAEPGGISESKKVPPRAARTDSDATVAPPPDTAVGCGVPKRRRSKDKPPADTAESDEFWRAYPRHDDKYRFRFAFAEALKKASAAELIAGAKHYAATRAGEDPKWTKLAVNWLREERWLDEPAPARVVDQEGNPVTSNRVNGHRMGAGEVNIERHRQMLREMGAIR